MFLKKKLQLTQNFRASITDVCVCVSPLPVFHLITLFKHGYPQDFGMFKLKTIYAS